MKAGIVDDTIIGLFSNDENLNADNYESRSCSWVAPNDRPHFVSHNEFQSLQ